ncbi:MAG: twin transmembrane helix small protein [Notoacmeibacter sp.]|nr:twin transmembrane helix small protein [Notoacmeibacter sp.]
MGTLFNILATVAVVAVAIVLLRGLFNLMRGGDSGFSNKMMQLRVFLQFIAIVMIVLAIYFARPA